MVYSGMSGDIDWSVVRQETMVGQGLAIGQTTSYRRQELVSHLRENVRQVSCHLLQVFYRAMPTVCYTGIKKHFIGYLK
jgi:hypothetical protein